MSKKIIKFNRGKVEKLRESYKDAIGRGDSSFWFEGNEWVTGYAKYALEYLDMRNK